MHGLEDLPSLEDFGAQLDRVAARDTRHTVWWRRRPGGSLLLASALTVGLAGTAAAGTLAALRATVVPGPTAETVAPEMQVRPQTVQVSALRATDPGGAPPWTVRSVRTVTGELCLTVGQRRDEDFGLVGLDGRFRTLAPSIVDGCTETTGKGLELSAARVLDGATRRDVRTVLYGLVARDVRRVILRDGNATRRLAVEDGRFVAVVRGFPEDRPMTVVAITARGPQGQSFGASPRLSPQTGGVPALKLSGYVVDDARDRFCVGLGPARETGEAEGRGGSACGLDGHPFGVVRRVHRGRNGWGDLPSRTLVFGSWPSSGARLRSVTVTAGRRVQRARLLSGRGFLAVLPASTDPAGVRVVVLDQAGHRTTFTRSLGLVKDPLG